MCGYTLDYPAKALVEFLMVVRAVNLPSNLSNCNCRLQYVAIRATTK